MLNYALRRREEEYQNLNNFTTKVHHEIMNVVSTLGWSMDSMKTDNDNSLICSYDSSHRISRRSLDRHLESCQWRKEGYNEYSVPLSESCFSSSSPSSIKLDASLQNSILQEAKKKDSTMIVGRGERLIPRTSDRIFADFTRDERKALYEYVVSCTINTDIGHDIADTRKPKDQSKDDKKLSLLELLVQERNLKRRRAKHKGVHTNKKSHTEILREVINQQMEEYTNYMTETRASSCDTKRESVAEVQNSNNLPLRFNEATSKHRNLLLENAQNNHGNSAVRHNESHRRLEKSSTSYDKGLDKRDKYSEIIAESWKSRKFRKHKRSRSRERDHDRRSKRDYSRQDRRKHSERCYESKKSSNGNVYLKYKKDHRENREKFEL
ncbi:U11/U12 small nuclear ribonucleoprotein 48 kDa protein [Megachile rotundata]|uniref:U11/U12 small nuclear ribonucleoprotein 48 kDa protein n=1 Tax=Megachile rotundata TaxID=143995 RepID=UPI000258E8CC|nr:PREDICTED: U11/U12 small nuclear ribonucleoprotein 48 kDa protein-like [Megachile rotundata]XP_012142652.1 PREDICTED: U11/U12 small nuclear ribonucleoprotein 48 kDa protein-like [Megachile rotundata]